MRRTKRLIALLMTFVMVVTSVIIPAQVAMAREYYFFAEDNEFIVYEGLDNYVEEIDDFAPISSQTIQTIYDMQRDPSWNSMSSATAHPIMRGTNSPSGANRIDRPSRELHILVRNGTSQGLRIRAISLLNAISEGNSVRIEYYGRLNVAGYSQIRIEQNPVPEWEQGVNVWTEPVDSSNAFSQSVTLTHQQLQHAVTEGTGDITLGAVPGNAELVITGIRITEVMADIPAPTPIPTPAPTPTPQPTTVYNMQNDPNWSNLSSATAHPIMRGTNSAGGATRVDRPSRELHILVRGGTSQGLRIRANALLNALSGGRNQIRIEYTGQLNVAGYSQIRIEQNPAPAWAQGVNVWTEPTGAGNVFTQTVILTREQLQHATTEGTGDITLGAVPGNAELVITGIRITAIYSSEPIPTPTPEPVPTPSPAPTPEPTPTPSPSPSPSPTPSPGNNNTPVGGIHTVEIDGAIIEFRLNRYWATGYNAELRIHNTGTEPIYEWVLSMNRPMGLGANFHNGGRVAYQGSSETTIGYLDHNAPIPAGGFISIWLYGSTLNGVVPIPTDYRLTRAERRVVPTEDYTLDVRVHSEWEPGQLRHAIVLRNRANRFIQGWEVEFDIIGGAEITASDIWRFEQSSRCSAMLTYILGTHRVWHHGQELHLGMSGTTNPGTRVNIENVVVFERVAVPYGGWEDWAPPVQVPDNTVNRLNWPVNSMEVTLWFGQLDGFTDVESPGINIQCTTYNAVHSISNGVIAQVTHDRVYVDFRHNGIYKQAIFGNVIPDSQLSEGDKVEQGAVIAQMRPHLGRYVLELIVQESANGERIVSDEGNANLTNPSHLFDLSGMMNNLDFLTRPMANFFSDYSTATHFGMDLVDAVSFSYIQPFVEEDITCIHVRFARNYDLVEYEEMYLRRVIQTLFDYHDLASEGLTMDDILQWNECDGTATVFLFGEVALFIPSDMCEGKALYNHSQRLGIGNIEAIGISTTYNIEAFSTVPEGGVEFFTQEDNRNNRIVVGMYVLGVHASTGTENLRLPNNKYDRNDILMLLNGLTDDSLTTVRTGGFFTLNRNRHWVVEYTSTGGSDFPLGTELIRELVNSPRTVRIHLIHESNSNQNSRVEYYNSSGSFDPTVGSSVGVFINTRAIVRTLLRRPTGDGDYVIHEMNSLPPIILAHELIHAYRGTRGLRVSGEANYSYLNAAGGTSNDRTSREELETIGIRHTLNNGTIWEPESARFTENAIRREQGLYERVRHDPTIR
ncbi:MAG: cellulose binding domain-containing protein [Defluviitaleaceae bacterium]|nr:cellulose binding domain-containing protein [Defluviitaleaceae bacterium]MCL2262602.1 cellulose binding domain-containing protein [Defluviitaleaceae bacterium]